MIRGIAHVRLAAILLAAMALGACRSGSAAAKAPADEPAPVASAPMAAVEQPIARFIRATGTLTAEAEAEVAAETPGRVISSPVERGSPVGAGAILVRLSSAETTAQLQEAEANAAQIAARLGLASGGTFDVNAVPEVQNAKATFDLAQGEFARIRSLLDQRVVSQSEFDQRRTQVEATRQQFEAAKNAAAQQFQSLQGARARVALASKALADTVVRAPFAGIVAERLVSTGDYVTKGMKIAVVVQVHPLRVQLTVPEQSVASVQVGQPVSFAVDAYADRRFDGRVKYVSPSLQAAQRALVVEAEVPNPDGALKPGLFATARIELSTRTPGVLVPAAAVLTSAGTSRVYVITGDRAEERIVTTGETVGNLVEITRGIKAGERVATQNVARLADGVKVS